jgi:hypothetical protein
MSFRQAKLDTEQDPTIAVREAEADRVFYLRDELNREMMRLTPNERRRRWPEYLIRLDELMKK